MKPSRHVEAASVERGRVSKSLLAAQARRRPTTSSREPHAPRAEQVLALALPDHLLDAPMMPTDRHLRHPLALTPFLLVLPLERRTRTRTAAAAPPHVPASAPPAREHRARVEPPQGAKEAEVGRRGELAEAVRRRPDRGGRGRRRGRRRGCGCGGGGGEARAGRDGRPEDEGAVGRGGEEAERRRAGGGRGGRRRRPVERRDPGVVPEQDGLARAAEVAVARDGQVVRLDAQLAVVGCGERLLEGVESVEPGRCRLGRCAVGSGRAPAADAPQADVVVLRARREEDLAGRDVVRRRGGRGRVGTGRDGRGER